jgi:hypothetical protein
MATLLFISPTELASTTILGGNVDIDKYTFTIEQTQIMTIEPLLGTDLFDKIVTLVTAGTIADAGNELYNTLYTEYIKPITKYQSMAEYIEISSYTLDNAGLIKNTPDNAEVVNKDEAQMLSQKYSAMAQMYIKRFYKWICKNTIAEYKTIQDEVDAQRYMKVTGGLWFGQPSGIDEDDLGFVNTGNGGDFLELE